MKTKVRIQYTLQEDELALTQTKKPKKNQLCFAIMLKHFQIEGNHPRATKYINASLINCIAQQLKIKTNHLEYFNWEGKSTERYRVEIREFCGYPSKAGHPLKSRGYREPFSYLFVVLEVSRFAS